MAAIVTRSPGEYGRTELGAGGRKYGGLTKPATFNNWPQVTVAVSFTTKPREAPVWIDLSDRVRALWIRRGRSTELSRYEAGTAGVTLDNRDRALDPTNSASEFWPNVKPMKRIRIGARWGYASYPQFTGYVEKWPPAWDDYGTDGTVEVQCVDAFKVFSMVKLSTSLALQRSDVRIANLLSLIGWPVADQALMVGQSNVQGVTLDKAFVLEQLQATAEAENGAFFMRGDGTAVFLDRLTPSLQGVTGATFGDVEGELPYEKLGLDYGEDETYNEVKFTREGGTEQVVSDSASDLDYYTRTLSATGLLTTSDTEVLASAQYQLAKRKLPIFRFPTMQVNPLLDPFALWPVVLGTDLTTAITVRRRPPSIVAGQPVIEKTVAIQGIDIDVERGHWTTNYNLGSPDIQSLFQLDSPTTAQLDTTATLSF